MVYTIDCLNEILLTFKQTKVKQYKNLIIRIKHYTRRTNKSQKD